MGVGEGEERWRASRYGARMGAEAVMSVEEGPEGEERAEESAAWVLCCTEGQFVGPKRTVKN